MSDLTPPAVLVVGAGKRVLEAALPAFAAAGFPIARVFARSARTLDAAGGPHRVQPLDELDDAALSEAGLVYLCVPKDAIPQVLARLTRHDVSGTDLLVDTPVVRFKHFRHAAKARAFRAAWVPEDCATLPWIPLARRVVGDVREVLLLNAGYAYHGLATGRALLGAERIRAGRRRALGGPDALREVTFAGGGRLTVIEPRRYDLGQVVVRGAEGTVSSFESEEHAAGATLLRVELEGSLVRALACGDAREELDDAEAELTRGDAPEAGPIARQDAFKRVGLLRLLRQLAAGAGAYPLDHGLEDMVVDYHLEKLGRYRANPFTSPRWASGRALLSAVTRLGG